MGVKSNVKGADESKKNPFPRLMVNDRTDLVVLFSDPDVGTVVSSKDACEVGDYVSDWIMDHFTDFEGTITLENE